MPGPASSLTSVAKSSCRRKREADRRRSGKRARFYQAGVLNQEYDVSFIKAKGEARRRRQQDSEGYVLRD